MSKFYQKIRGKFIYWLTRDAPIAEFPPCDFSRIQHEVRPADVLLIEGRSRVSEVISYLTKSPWTHAALYIGRLHDIEDKELCNLIAANSRPQDKIKGNTALIIEGYLGQGTIVAPLT